MSISWRLVSFTQSQSTPYNIIRCNQDRFLYYLSVYVKSFKELFSYLLVRGVFLKSECKSTNYFPNTQEFRRKSLKINSYLTVRVKNKRLYCPTLIILYTRGLGCACARGCITDKFLFSPQGRISKTRDESPETGIHKHKKPRYVAHLPTIPGNIKERELIFLGRQVNPCYPLHFSRRRSRCHVVPSSRSPWANRSGR